MSKNAAPEEKLGNLHMAVADALIEGLQPKPILDEDKEIIGFAPVDPRIISSAVTFLNNNKIKHTPFLDEKASEIQEMLNNRQKRFKVVASNAAEKAANNA